MTALTIGQLSKKVELPTKTIRFYEEIGLIAKPERAENGYRVYDKKTIEELVLIKHARDLGLPIPEIKKLMIGCEDGNCEHTKQYIKKEVDTYLEVLEKKIKQLQALKTKLLNLKGNMEITETCNDLSYCCNILKQITDVSKGGDKDGRENMFVL